MAENEVVRQWYRSRIQERHREANRLSIEVGLKAQEKEDLRVLAETMESLDTAVRVLERARVQLAA